MSMHVRFGTTVVSLICANWRGYSWRQLELSPDFQSLPIKVITKLPNSEQSYKGKVKTHIYINRQNQSTSGKL